ncbi:hypothetical protein A9237_18060 [Vibrio owensii]|nr:hypothetical protein A9237_18060 [Vibrio owensii]
MIKPINEFKDWFIANISNNVKIVDKNLDEDFMTILLVVKNDKLIKIANCDTFIEESNGKK